MRRKLKDRISDVKAQLELTDEQMAKHLQLRIDTYNVISSGSKKLPFVAEKAIERRLERMLAWCGINMEQRKP